MPASAQAEFGIDVGCGPMDNRPYFRSTRYVGVDLDVDRLVTGRRRFPGALAVAMRIEQDCGVAGDFVLCVQMFVNRHFPAEQTLEGVDLDVDRLVTGRRLFPGALAVAMRVEQDCGVAGDFVRPRRWCT